MNKRNITEFSFTTNKPYIACNIEGVFCHLPIEKVILKDKRDLCFNVIYKDKLLSINCNECVQKANNSVYDKIIDTLNNC